MAIDPRFFSQAQTFITESMKSVIPDANVDGGSGINAVLGRGGATISASLLQEIEHVLTSRDLSNIDSLLEEDVDLILENLLTSRDGGDLAFGFVRIFYPDRTQRQFLSGLTATIDSKEVNFVTLSDFVFNPQDYFLDAGTGNYFINVPFTAEEAGEQYNVDVGEINQLTNDLTGALRVTNVAAFRNGKEPQTNAQALRKAQRAVSTRTPLSRDGTIFFFQELFGGKLQDLLVVGAGDDEMLRDEVYDLGEGSIPRFQIGVDSIDPVTREQQGQGQELFVGGRTDVYSLYDTINFVQETVDLFADMLLDTDVPPTGIGSIQATFVTGTTGEIPTTGKIIIDLGNAGEEVVSYFNAVATDPSNNTFIFSLDENTTLPHDIGATIKVVNNNDLTIAPNGDINVLPVFQISEVRVLDPVTFKPIGDPLPETSATSRVPGWYISRTNPYDLLSARETKSLVIDEKRDALSWPGNQAQSAVAPNDTGTTEDIVIGGGTHTKYTKAGANFTGYEGREITLTGGVSATRNIVQVLTATDIVLSGGALPESVGDVGFVIESAFADFNEFPVRVSYYTNTEIAEAQQFLDQDARRILAGDVLSRAYFPVFLDFVMRYRGDGEPIDIRERLNEVLQTSSGDAIGESTGAKFEYSDLINAAYQDGLANYVETPFEVKVRRLQLDGTFRTDYVNPSTNTVNEMAISTDNGVVYFSGDGSYSGGSDTFGSGTYTFTGVDVDKKIWIQGVGLATIIGTSAGAAVLNITLPGAGIVFGVSWSFPVFFIEARTVTPFIVPPTGRLFLGGFTSNKEEFTYSEVVANGGDVYTFILDSGQFSIFPHPADEPLRVSVSEYDEANVITDGVITDERTYRPFLANVVIEKL